MVEQDYKAPTYPKSMNTLLMFDARRVDYSGKSSRPSVKSLTEKSPGISRNSGVKNSATDNRKTFENGTVEKVEELEVQHTRQGYPLD